MFIVKSCYRKIFSDLHRRNNIHHKKEKQTPRNHSQKRKTLKGSAINLSLLRKNVQPMRSKQHKSKNNNQSHQHNKRVHHQNLSKGEVKTYKNYSKTLNNKSQASKNALNNKEQCVLKSFENTSKTVFELHPINYHSNMA